MPSRKVIKEGYLKKLFESNNIFKRPLRRWYILVLVNNIPVLEYYTTREESLVKRPINDYNLSECQLVQRNLGDQEKGRFTFIVILPTRRVNLEAGSLQELDEWISRMELVLQQFGAVEIENTYGRPESTYGETYSALDDVGSPASVRSRSKTVPIDDLKKGIRVELPTTRSNTLSSDSSAGSAVAKKRDVPLPGLPQTSQKDSPPAAPLSSEVPDDWINNPFVFPADPDAPPVPPRRNSSPLVRPRPKPTLLPDPPIESKEDVYGCAWDNDEEDARSEEEENENVYGCAWEDTCNGFDNGDIKSTRSKTVETMIRQLECVSARVTKLDLTLHDAGVEQNTAVEEIEEDVYDRLESKLEAMCEWDQLTELRTRRNQSAHNVFKPNPDAPPFEASAEPFHAAGFFEKKIGLRGCGEMVDHQSVKDGMLTVQRLNSCPSSTSNSLFITAGPDASLSALAGAVESLKKQILSPGGVSIRIQMEDLRNHVALVEIDNRVWVAGWNPKVTRLHHSLHIGDQVMGVNERIAPIESVKMLWKMMDAMPYDESRVSLRLRRLPWAKVVAIRRDLEGQALGLVRVGGTNEISFVKQGGLIARHGLPTLCKNFDPANCGFLEGNWFITEVNGRTLNLFYKNNEVEVALNAYGKEISLVVQPTDFVKRLKKAIKAARKFKGYVGYN